VDLGALEADDEVVGPAVVDGADPVPRLEALGDGAVAVGDALEDGVGQRLAGVVGLDRGLAQRLVAVEGVLIVVDLLGRVERIQLQLIGLG
jgi:hypothetical protein